ncbi:cyclin-like protein, partial [Blyttiomyces helicus]
NSFFNTDPLLVVVTCIYLACKIEECPHHIKNIVTEMKHILGRFHYDIATIAEFEFYLLEDLDFHMILYHPYRPLMLFIVNDTYRTDLCLLYPPHIIALAAVYMTSALNEEAFRVADVDVKTWLSGMSVDIEELAYVTQEILDLYQLMGTYGEDQI